MKKAALLSLFVWVSSACENKPTEDFTDRIIAVVLENPKGQSIEFPDLYPEKINAIASEQQERLLIAEKLTARGFQLKSTDREFSPLAGTRRVIQKLSKENCLCEVTKTYHSTEIVSQFTATERLKCY